MSVDNLFSSISTRFGSPCGHKSPTRPLFWIFFSSRLPILLVLLLEGVFGSDFPFAQPLILDFYSNDLSRQFVNDD